MKNFLIIILILIVVLIAFFFFNRYFKTKSIFEEIKLPQPLYEP